VVGAREGKSGPITHTVLLRRLSLVLHWLVAGRHPEILQK